MKRKNIKKVFATVMSVVCIASLTACSNKTDTTEDIPTQTSVATGEETTQTANALSFEVQSKIDEKDEEVNWKSEHYKEITLADESITLTEAGTYVVSGTLKDGQIIVDATDQKVWIVLNSAEITCSNSSAIYVKDAKKVIITAEQGTTNTLTDAETYTYEDAEKEEPNACIFSKDDLVINGTGTINVVANANTGISSKNDLIIVGTKINVTAYNHGFRGKDSLCIKSADITIEAGGDGMKSSNNIEEGRGFICIESGKFNITSGQDGIQAETCMLVQDGEFKIVSGGGSVNGSSSNSKWGNWGPMKQNDDSTSSTQESASAKGIKAGVDLKINGGTFELDTSDDSLHTNNNIIINNGTFTIASGDDGTHADGETIINNGKITITKSYEGLEGASVTINGGEVDIIASDDGINASGGSDTESDTETDTTSTSNGRMGGGADQFQAVEGANINITGGNVIVNADGDGVDANGNLTISGGMVIVYGPTDSGNGALDYNGKCTVSGGTLIAAGASGMSENISSSSTQYGFEYVLSNSASANSTFTVKDSSGNMIIEQVIIKSYQSVVVSTSDIKDGETYTIYVDEVEQGTITQSGVSTTNGTGGMGQGGKGQGGRNDRQMPNGEAPVGEVPTGDFPVGGTVPNHGEEQQEISTTKGSGTV